MPTKSLRDHAGALNDEQLAALAGGWRISPVEKDGAWYGELDQQATADYELIRDPDKKRSALKFASGITGKPLIDFIPFK